MIVACTLLLGYAAICALAYFAQTLLLFPGAGRGDRGLQATPSRARVEWIEHEGIRTRILVLESGHAGPLVLYFPGNGEDLASAARVSEELADHACSVLAVEYPGYGASEGSPSMDALLRNARAAASFAKSLAARLGVPLCVTGSSLGTFCAVRAAADGGVWRLLLRAPPTTMADAARARFWWLPVRMLLRHPFDNLSPAPGVLCPVLIVHGQDDRVVAPELGARLARALPSARFVLVPGHGHNDLSLARDGPVGGEIASFLEGP